MATCNIHVPPWNSRKALMTMPIHMPFSPEGMQRLAGVLGVSEAQLWLEPNRGRLEIKSWQNSPDTRSHDEAQEDEAGE